MRNVMLFGPSVAILREASVSQNRLVVAMQMSNTYVSLSFM
jgi:hypothetical protein